MNLVRRACAAALLAALLPAASAQATWPTKPVTLLVPYSAGGSLDGTARLLAQKLTDTLGMQVVVENVTGAGGALGFGKAVQATPDGHTLLLAGDAPLMAGANGGAVYRYDVLKQLQPVVLVNTAPMVLVAAPTLPVNNLGELVALAKAKPGKLSYATSGIGTLPHLATEMLRQQAQVELVHIPYRGGAQIANDVAGGQVDLAMLVAASATPFVQAKTVKALAVSGPRRLASLPGVPAAAETDGFKNFGIVSWSGVYVPAKVPEAVIERINHAFDAVLQSDAVREALARQGAQAGGGSAAAFASFIQQDRAKVASVLRDVSLRD